MGAGILTAVMHPFTRMRGWLSIVGVGQLPVASIMQEIMVGIVQLVERQTVDLDVAGSSPVTHPAVRAGSRRKSLSQELRPAAFGCRSRMRMRP